MNTTKIENKNPTTEEVRVFIKEKIEKTFNEGSREVIIRAGDIHEEMNMYRAWKVVCEAMRKLEPFYQYEIVFTPKQKNGANLKYIYSRKFNN